MNYLAHIFLSSSPQEQVGNFIGDFVKGKDFEKYPTEIQKGILLHRAIDYFTDTHPIVIAAKALLRDTFGRYAGVVTDMYFDHFLAVHFSDYSSVKLRKFSYKFYWALWYNRKLLPPRVKGFLWHFISTNRLCRYATLDGLRSSLNIMSQYKAFPVNSDEVIAFLRENYQVLDENFKQFFPELIDFAKDTKNKNP